MYTHIHTYTGIYLYAKCVFVRQNTKSKIRKGVSTLLLPIEANIQGDWDLLIYTARDSVQIDVELNTR